MRVLLLAAFLTVCTTVTTDAQTLRNGGVFYARVSFGYGKQALGDVNSAIRDDIQFFESAGIPVNFDTFDGDKDLGAEVGFRVSETVSLGAGINYQKNDLSNSYTDLSGTYLDDISLTILELTGNITLWIPSAPGVFFGASGGMGYGDLEEFLSFRIFGDPASSFTVDSTADGSGFTGGVFGGYEANFPSGLSLFGKAGYRLRNLGEFDASQYSPELGSYNGPVENSAGHAMDFDFSGAYVVAGFGFTLGGTR